MGGGGKDTGESRELRVLHVVDSLGAGGMENGIVNVANRLVGPVDSWVAALSGRGVFAARMPVPSQVVALGKTAGFSIAVAKRLAAMIAECRPDVVHTHNLGPLLYVSLARLLSTGRGWMPPVIHGEHSMLEGEELGRKRMLQRRCFYRGCDVVHTVSRGLLDSLQESGLHARRMEVIINGVDGERFSPAAGGDSGEEGGSLVMGIVGRLVARKRHLMLLDVFERIASDFPALRLLIVGDQGPERDRLEAAIAASPVEDRIEWVPFQESPELFYRKMHLLVVPSESEGLANVVLESMASGVPVVGSLACGTPEVVEDGRTGYLGEIGCAEDLERLLRRALDGGKMALAETGKRARQEVLERFSLKAMADAYLELYRSMPARPGPA